MRKRIKRELMERCQNSGPQLRIKQCIVRCFFLIGVTVLYGGSSCRQRDSLRGVSTGQPLAPCLQGGWPRPQAGHSQTAEGNHQPRRDQSGESLPVFSLSAAVGRSGRRSNVWASTELNWSHCRAFNFDLIWGQSEEVVSSKLNRAFHTSLSLIWRYEGEVFLKKQSNNKSIKQQSPTIIVRGFYF